MCITMMVENRKRNQIANYLSFCESLWRDWLKGTPEVSPFVRSRFDLDAAPEPYLQFQSQESPLVALTTNPGATMPHQMRKNIQKARGVIRCTMSYKQVASR